MLQPIPITEDGIISYFPPQEDPLSANIGIIQGDKYTWLFDVGNGELALEAVNSITRPKNAVLSHFHPDHIGNIAKSEFENIYQGVFTYRHTGIGNVVKGDIYIEDGVLLHLFELPSSHSKGSLGLEVNGKYAFLGDGAYAMNKNGQTIYNASLLIEEIRKLRSLEAEWLLLSHRPKFIHKKSGVIALLEKIYAKRDANEPYIYTK